MSHFTVDFSDCSNMINQPWVTDSGSGHKPGQRWGKVAAIWSIVHEYLNKESNEVSKYTPILPRIQIDPSYTQTLSALTLPQPSFLPGPGPNLAPAGALPRRLTRLCKYSLISEWLQPWSPQPCPNHVFPDLTQTLLRNLPRPCIGRLPRYQYHQTQIHPRLMSLS